MENKLIQSLLTAGLLDIGDSDERLANIEKAVTDLETKLKENLSLLPSYTLVGLDPNINETEPVLEEVEAIVSTYWKALRAKFTERPIPILRAVILHALFNIGINDAKLARIIYLTGSNFYPFAKLSREKEVVSDILTQLANISEKNATEEWSIAEEEPNLKLGTLKIGNIQFSNITLAEDELRAKLKTAAKNDPQGHGPYHHQEQWSEHFKQHAGDGIIDILKLSFEELGKSLTPSSFETPINKFFTDFKKSLDLVLKNSFNTIRAVERRSKLLWWKETLYSASLKNSYRTVDAFIQPVIMANDLYQQLPSITPVSVDFLLKDTIILLNNSANTPMSFAQIIDELTKDDNKQKLREYFDDVEKVEKRITVYHFLSLLIHEKVQATSLKQFTGIDLTEQIGLTDLAVILLHDLMAEYLIPAK